MASGYAFQIESAHRVALAGFSIREVPISFTDRTEGTSKMSKAIVLEAVTHVPRLRWDLRHQSR